MGIDDSMRGAQQLGERENTQSMVTNMHQITSKYPERGESRSREYEMLLGHFDPYMRLRTEYC